MRGKIKVHLVDDHQIVIDGMLAVLKLEDDIEVVGFSLNGDGLLDRIQKNAADVLIMDINMPNKDGISILKDFQKENIKSKIIILSSYDDLKIIKEVTKLGANGYLSKSCAAENIHTAIQAVCRGEQYYCDAIQKQILNTFSGTLETQAATRAPIPSSLTARELDVLRLIVQEYSTKDIGAELCLSPHTVDTHRKKMMNKLQVKTAIGLVKFAIKHKLV